MKALSDKYLVVLGDGMADEPLKELGGRTPLEAAETPNMDYIAKEGAMGLLQTVPPGFSPGSDIANLSVLGYDPVLCYTGRGPLEAASMELDLDEEDMAYRCNLVTIRRGLMEDFTACHITSGEGAALLKSLNEELEDVVCFPGISYRNLMIVPGGAGSETIPPHDITGQAAEPYLPKGADAVLLLHAMEVSRKVFADHEVNTCRIEAGKRPATEIWPWSGGRRPDIQNFEQRYGLSGGMIAAVDLLNGIAKYAGMEVITVPGATGYLDTDYQAKARYAINGLKRLDFIFLHVEAPDEAGHMGSIEEKILAIERVDEMIGTILDSYKGRIAVLPDHPTPIRIKTHSADPVPFAILGIDKDQTTRFSEIEAASGMYGVREGIGLLPLLIG